MLVLSAIFALIGWGANCYPEINFGNSIPHGLMILSGLGDMILDSDETTNVCFWTHTAAIIVGVYIVSVCVLVFISVFLSPHSSRCWEGRVCLDMWVM